MPKEALKQRAIDEGQVCVFTQEDLADFDYSLYDTHRTIPKAKNGSYDPENTNIANPVAHMEHHGNKTIREEALEKIKAKFEDRKHVMMLRIKINNQLLAYKRGTDTPLPHTVEWLENQLAIMEKANRERDAILVKAITELTKTNKLAQAMASVPMVGPVTMAGCLYYLDCTEADHASSYWKYVGLHTPSHSRYIPGEKSGGNKTLRSILHNFAAGQLRGNGTYRPLYDAVKARLEISEVEVLSRKVDKTWAKMAWKDTKPSHRHGAGLRKMIKHFLADLWYVSRELSGLPTTCCWAEERLGSTHKTILPRERGWVY